ncbi:M23 family peptidase [Dysgonomonas sp. 216]|uniref:M23 family metallopeptidase n=1 Tax=Dysgonomonas sp. 216 TaxID=2302934 RepID=UPI0013D495C5|nr:M23 family metallopeptidase [Dysgonomonas sp. 216]NDW19039.1 M23 family peptidase [Dysgonomonas sp. 216]
MSKRKNNKHDFWKRIHFKYKLSVINENTLEEVAKIRTSKFWGTLLVFFLVIILMVLSSIVIISTPIRNYLPGYLDSEIMEQALMSAIRADSLEQQLLHQSIYISNIQDIFAGKISVDSLTYADTVSISEDDKSLRSTNTEKDFNRKFEEEEKYTISVLSPNTAATTENITFFRPVKGVISDKYNPSIKHYGVDIVAAPKASVVAALEGTVIFAGFDANVGYIIQIQHSNGFISVYKHNAMLLKEIGDEVRTGEAIAIIGDTGKLSNGAHLHFELWYKGKPVNPELYISF